MAADSSQFSTGKIFPMIIKFSVPAAASLLITAVYNIVDRIFVGNYVGNTALASLSICFPVSFMMIAFGLNCSAGGSTLFTIFRGRKKLASGDKSFGNAVVLTIISEIFLTIILLLFSDTFLKIFGVTPTTYDLALKYYKIVALGCIFQGLTLVFCDYVRVSGKPILGMMVTGVGAVVNIIFDYVFVAVFQWGVEGAAIATVMGQIVSTLFGGILILAGYSLVKIDKKIFLLNKKMSIEIIRCGFAFWIAQMAMGFISLFYNSQLGKYGGDTAISVYAVISSIMTFVIMPASGISQGIQPIVGYNYSTKNGSRVVRTMELASYLSVGITFIIWLIVQIFPQWIITLFGGDRELLAIGVSALRINFIITPTLGFIMLCTTFFQSLGKPNASIIISIIRQIVALVPFIYILPKFMGVNGIFWAQPVSDFIALILCIFLLKKEAEFLKNQL